MSVCDRSPKSVFEGWVGNDGGEMGDRVETNLLTILDMSESLFADGATSPETELRILHCGCSSGKTVKFPNYIALHRTT
jgi:hypothetical protein